MQRFFFLFCLLAVICHNFASAQLPETNQLVNYAEGLRAKQALLLNITGKQIIIDKAAGKYTGPFFARLFPGFGLRMGYKADADTTLDFPAYHVTQIDKKIGTFLDYYFIQKTTDSVIGIQVATTLPLDKNFVNALLHLALEVNIDDSILSELSPPVVVFAGRSIPVDKSCRWRSAGCIQCHLAGEISWSLFPTLALAENHTKRMLDANYPAKGALIQDRQIKKYHVEKEEKVEVFMEGTAVPAERITYKIDGMVGQLALMEGSRTLIVYYVSAPVRGRFVSCILSHWTSDFLEEGLPPLLGQIMKLK